MRCGHCGMEMGEKQRRCPYCGAVQEKAPLHPVKELWHIPFVALLFIAAFCAMIFFLRLNHDRSAMMNTVYEAPYRNLSLGYIFSSTLGDPEWTIDKDGVVFVEGDMEDSAGHSHLRVGFGSSGARVYVTSMTIDGKLVSVDSVYSILDGFYKDALIMASAIA